MVLTGECLDIITVSLQFPMFSFCINLKSSASVVTFVRREILKLCMGYMTGILRYIVGIIDSCLLRYQNSRCYESLNYNLN